MLPMTKRQFDRERLRQVRERELRLLEQSRAAADPTYVIGGAGFWLRKSPGSPDPVRNWRLRADLISVPQYFGA
jgi:hypothetical protein